MFYLCNTCAIHMHNIGMSHMCYTHKIPYKYVLQMWHLIHISGTVPIVGWLSIIVKRTFKSILSRSNTNPISIKFTTYFPTCLLTIEPLWHLYDYTACLLAAAIPTWPHSSSMFMLYCLWCVCCVDIDSVSVYGAHHQSTTWDGHTV